MAEILTGQGRSPRIELSAEFLVRETTPRGGSCLVLYRKRESASSTHEHGVFARFRYNDLKVAAGGCGGCGLRGPI